MATRYFALAASCVVRMPGIDRLYTSQGFETAEAMKRGLAAV